MTREELKEHCLNEIKMCEIWARRNGEESCRKVYEEHKLILELLEQESRKGHWIDTKENSTNTRGQIIHEVICSECNGIAYFRSIGNKYIGANICPNCGADMVEPQKSEGRNETIS